MVILGMIEKNGIIYNDGLTCEGNPLVFAPRAKFNVNLVISGKH
jgi:hypothetical protein